MSDVIDQLGVDLNLDLYYARTLENTGSITLRAERILLDDLLTTLFEGIQVASTRENLRIASSDLGPIKDSDTWGSYTFRKENGRYYFGTSDQLSLRTNAVIYMRHRSIELLSDPQGSNRSFRQAGRTSQNSVNFVGSQGVQNTRPQGGNRSALGSSDAGLKDKSPSDAILSIIPGEVKADLEIEIDYELNSFLISGPTMQIDRFRRFVRQIDKPVPVVLIEVMLIEVRTSTVLETGISWGLGTQPTTTSGGLFPTTDLTLGATTVNRIIGGFNGFGSLNVGRVVPEFFAQIKAMEENGNIKIKSAPKLSTLNGHRAFLSIGETTYYVVTSQNFFGSQIPTSSEIRNFEPIDAELALSIKPLVSGDGFVTLDINVIQSNFNNDRIDAEAPPGLTSREFSSIIRMRNKDLAVLGGLEENLKNDSGSGVPFLARVPLIKYLFSKRRREASKQKLTILIQPTVYY